MHRTTRTTRTTALAALLACGGPCLADEPIATDRPDFVESSLTVGQGRAQVESSVAWEQDDAGGLRTTTFATPTLFRYGVSDRWELRLETDGWLRQRSRAQEATHRASGAADLSLGAKYHLRERDGGPSMAWLLHADLATGAAAFAGHGVRPSVRFVAEWDLPADCALGVMPGVVREDDGSGRGYTAGILGVVLGKAWTPRWRSFVEVAAAQLARERDGGDVVSLDLGGAWLVHDALQLDFAVSAGLTDAAPDRALTVGLSRRW